MSKIIRKYGWWVVTSIVYVLLIAAYIFPVSRYVWLLSGVVFIALWVKAETVADKNAAEELSAKKREEEMSGSIVFGELDYPLNSHPISWDDYLINDDEMEDALLEDESHLETV